MESLPELDYHSTSSLTDSTSMDARHLEDLDEDDEDNDADDEEDLIIEKARVFDGSEGFIGIPKRYGE